MASTRTSRTAALLAASALAAGGALTATGPASATPTTSDDDQRNVDIRIEPGAADRLSAAGQARLSRLGDSVVGDVVQHTTLDLGARGTERRLAQLDDDGREVVVSIQRTRGGWADGVAYVTAPHRVDATPEGWLFSARFRDGQWRVATEGERAFARQMRRSPLLDQRERRVMTTYATAPQRDDARTGTGLQLPIPNGSSAYLTGGPHPMGGEDVYSSVDISGGTGDARSAAGGEARVMCDGWARVIHPNGYSTDYYHLENFQGLTGPVDADAYLGEQGNSLCAGGSSTGAHIHFAVRNYDENWNGWYVPISGLTVGGWTFQEDAGNPYGGYAVNGDGTTVYPGGEIHNYGPS